MVKAYYEVKKIYINGEMVREYHIRKVLKTEKEVSEYKTEHYKYTTPQEIKDWCEKEGSDWFYDIRIIYPFFGYKFLGLYDAKNNKTYKLKDYPDLSVAVVKYELKETKDISIDEILKDKNSEKAIQYLVERGMNSINQLTSAR